MIDIITAALSAYIIAVVIAASSICEPFRIWFMRKTPKLRIGQNKHFIECRLCVSFWSALVVVLVFQQNLSHVLPVYGLAYFMATQER